MAAASMTTAYALVLLLLFGVCDCLHAAEAAEPKDVVASVCATGTSDFCHIHLTTKFCVSTLRSDNRSARAQDARDAKQKYYNAECAMKLVHTATDCAHIGRYVEELGDELRWNLVNVARRTGLVKAMIEAMVGIKDPVEGFGDEFDDVHY